MIVDLKITNLQQLLQPGRKRITVTAFPYDGRYYTAGRQTRQKDGCA